MISLLYKKVSFFKNENVSNCRIKYGEGNFYMQYLNESWMKE